MPGMDLVKRKLPNKSKTGDRGARFNVKGFPMCEDVAQKDIFLDLALVKDLFWGFYQKVDGKPSGIQNVGNEHIAVHAFGVGFHDDKQPDDTIRCGGAVSVRSKQDDLFGLKRRHQFFHLAWQGFCNRRESFGANMSLGGYRERQHRSILHEIHQIFHLHAKTTKRIVLFGS